MKFHNVKLFSMQLLKLEKKNSASCSSNDINYTVSDIKKLLHCIKLVILNKTSQIKIIIQTRNNYVKHFN